MTDLRADSMTGEQFVFDERTADPASTEEGERWLRTDLTSGDKIATLRVDVGSSILDVPVFPVGTAEDSVVEAIRVRVGSQTGYIPAVPETNANFPALRLQHNGQVFGYHDEQGVFAFFDVAISATNSPVEEGSDLNVDYSVVNTGFSVNNTQDIRLNIDSTEEDRDTNITLSPSSSTTGTLTWTTPSSSAGTYNASVLSDDDTASTSVTVEAGPAIPDSVVQHKMDEGSGTDIFDSIDGADGSLIGATWESDLNAVGGFMTVYDGADDAAEILQADTVELGDTGTVAITVDPRAGSGNENAYMFHHRDGTTDTRLYIRFENTTEIRAGVVDSVPVFSYDWSQNTKHRFALVWDTGDLTVYAAKEGEASVSEVGSATYSGAVSTTASGWYYGAREIGAGIDEVLDGAVDNPIWFEAPLTQSELDDDFSDQPWS